MQAKAMAEGDWDFDEKELYELIGTYGKTFDNDLYNSTYRLQTL